MSADCHRWDVRYQKPLDAACHPSFSGQQLFFCQQKSSRGGSTKKEKKNFSIIPSLHHTLPARPMSRGAWRTHKWSPPTYAHTSSSVLNDCTFMCAITRMTIPFWVSFAEIMWGKKSPRGAIFFRSTNTMERVSSGEKLAKNDDDGGGGRGSSCRWSVLVFFLLPQCCSFLLLFFHGSFPISQSTLHLPTPLRSSVTIPIQMDHQCSFGDSSRPMLIGSDLPIFLWLVFSSTSRKIRRDEQKLCRVCFFLALVVGKDDESCGCR